MNWKPLTAAAIAAALVATLTGEATGADQMEGSIIRSERNLASIDAKGPVAPEPLGRWPAGPCSDWRFGEYLTSPAKFNAHLERSYRKMRRLAACVFDRFNAGPVPEYVIARESGWYPWAANPAGQGACRPFTDAGNYGSCGLAQHLSRYWEGRMRTYLRAEWFRRWPVSPFDPRANLVAMAKMIRAQGGVCPAWCLT